MYLQHLPLILLFSRPSLQISLAQDTATVNLLENTGPPQHLASGLLYGVPDTANQIPSHFYSDIGFNYLRAGGAQVPSPGRGWIHGEREYENRFQSALSNYRTARQFNATFIFLIHDLWGADGTQPQDAKYPGDKGDWSEWDKYLGKVVADMKGNGMIEAVQIDIWNEPDLKGFWNRGMEQYLSMWGRTYHILRRELPTIDLIGPAYAGSPDKSNPWWTSFLSFVAKNASIPDQYVWHMEGGGSATMDISVSNLNYMLSQYHLPPKPLNMDEYATFDEQNPAGAAWWISQLERHNAIGLRGNWLMGIALHDMLASLVSKPGAEKAYKADSTGYFPNGEFQVYKYYAQSMTGYRVATTASGDKKLDVFATVGEDAVRVLVGARLVTGTWQVRINGLSALGLGKVGEVSIKTWAFPFSGGHYGRVDGARDEGVVVHKFEGDSVTFPIFQKDRNTAYAFEIRRR